MSNVTLAISSDFFDAFAKLPRQIQRKVTDFINKFRNNPKSSAINYEKINNAADKKMCSVRIDDTYRGIVVRQEETGTYLLLWVDHHDEAYTWAMRKKCEINPMTGNIQIFEIQEKNDIQILEKPTKSIFSELSDENLIELAVPKEQLSLIRTISTLQDYYKIKQHLPVDAYENLEWIANGFSYEDVIVHIVNERNNKEINNDNFSEALQNIEAQRNFVIVKEEEELIKIMSEPLEKWRVFLHPTQKRIVEKKYSGPARILGGAGTGKTVVAMHRAKNLAKQLPENGKILFTTYTSNLANDIKDNLRKICSAEEQKKIEVINLDAWVSQYLKQQGYQYSIKYDDELNEIWETAVSQSGENLNFQMSFYIEEWNKVVCANEAYSLELYVRVPRIGRGIRLDRKARMQVWKVFEEYQSLMKKNKIRDINTAMYECKIILEKSLKAERYSSIIVDEGQDFSMNAYRLLRALAGQEHESDIFIVGDSHQRIYKNKAILSKSGINIRGRSNHLKINYRTTEETRKYAIGILNGISFDDLDDDYDNNNDCQSLTHGQSPIIRNFKSASEEMAFIEEELKKLMKMGINLKEVCIVARTHRLLDDYIAQFSQKGIKAYEIKRNKADDRSIDGIRVATMHRIKGLEFPYVFIVAVNKGIIPYKIQMNDLDDPTSIQEALTAEKCLMYVALTRAQKQAYITSYGTVSEFISEYAL